MVPASSLSAAAVCVRCGRAGLVFGLIGVFVVLANGANAGEPTNSVAQEVAKPEAATFPVIDSFAEYWRPEARELPRPIKMELLVDYYEGGWNHLWGRVLGEIGYLPCATSIPLQSHDR